MADVPPEPLTYSKTAAAKRLGISIKTFNAELKAGHFPFVTHIGKRIRVTARDLDAYLEGRRQPWGFTSARTHRIGGTGFKSVAKTPLDAALKQRPVTPPKPSIKRPGSKP